MSEEVQHIIQGTIGGVGFTEDDIVANSLSVTMSTCDKGNFTFGTFRAAVLKMTVRLSGAFEGFDFSGAKIVITKSGVNLGRYWINDSKTKRRGDLLTIEALDAASLFDVELPAAAKQQTYTASTACVAACTAVGVSSFAGITAGLPNQNVTFTPVSTSIQTWRDLVMWTAQLCAGNAVINRNGALEIRQVGYVAESDVDYISTASSRADIQFSDIRTWVKYMSAYSERKPHNYVSSGDLSGSDSDARPGSVALPLNPLLDGRSETECDTINRAIRSGVACLVRDISAKCTDDPSIALGDLCRFEGGRIDRRGSILGVVTGITWRFRGVTTVTCTAPTSVKEEA